MRHKLIVFAILFIAQPTWAAENSRFVAICSDEATHGYRAWTSFTGNRMEETWSTNERFGSTWTFQYDGGDQIFIDGKRGHVLAQHLGVLILSDMPLSNGTGAGAWIYAVQLGMQKIVASQVNAHGGLHGLLGVKARSTNLTCEFAFE